MLAAIGPCLCPSLVAALPQSQTRPIRFDSLWVELDRTGVKAVLIRFCGGQHLDHITAYSSDNAPVLELCRSDPRQVRACRTGLRYSTCNDVCYVESGYVPLKAIVKSRQRKFFTRMYKDRIEMHDDPFSLVLKLVMRTRYTTKTYLYDLINNSLDDIQRENDLLKDKLSRTETSRRTVYCKTHR